MSRSTWLSSIDTTREGAVGSFLCADRHSAFDIISPESSSSSTSTTTYVLGDALVASTALVYHHTVVTHNVRDFAWIDKLTVFDPLADEEKRTG